jgi:hypothetical protein
MHIKNVQIGGCTPHMHQFEVKVVLYSELDSKLESVISN